MTKNDQEIKAGDETINGKVLGPKDRFYFGGTGAWTGPTPEGGCMVYKVNPDKSGKFYVYHPDGSKQTHPPESRKYYKPGAKAYVCGTTVHLPNESFIEEVN